MLARTLDIVRALDHRQLAVISDDPDVQAVALRHGATAITDEGHGLNAALNEGRARFRQKGNDTSLLVLPIDLPDLDRDVLRMAVAADGDVVIACDGREDGTNLLLLSGAARDLAFSFGPGSYQRHCAAARVAGFAVTTLRDPRLSFDIDQPQDYAVWTARISN